MFSASSRPETTAAYPHYDRRLSYAGEQPQSYGHPSRAQYDLPRPFEPRPTLHSSLSDTTSLHRRQEPLRPVNAVPEHRTPGPNLPGLRDILTPSSSSPRNELYGSAWHLTPSSSAQTRPLHTQSYVHPPMVLEPRAQPAQQHRPISWEVPIRPTGPDASQPIQPVPPSPYSNHPSEYGQPFDNRFDRACPTPSRQHFSNGISSPYNGFAPDANTLGGSDLAFEHGQHQAVSTPTTESQKKYLGIRDVPGEGTYHVYEGGYRIPTHVDGEHVNPAWGLTKANKPRKRLALACLDCREKKIKCEPGASSCLQCEKAKRPCRRSQAQQSQADSAASTEWSPGGPCHSRNKASVSDPTPAPSRDAEPDTLSKRRSREDPSPPSVPHKKHRSASPVPAVSRDAPLPMRDRGVVAEPAPKTTLPARHGGTVSWEHDPYEVEPEITLQLLHLYFAHFNSATYCLYPRRHFMHWVKTSLDKCQNERMVLYAMLAMASIFADDSLSGFGRHCAHVALDFLPRQAGSFHTCTAQARILLALYSHARGEQPAAWDHSGAAIRAVQHLRYHTEEGCLDNSSIASQSRCEFDFSPAQHAECKRRTFWSAFFLDRYCEGTVTILKPQDVFLRLPCAEEMYECGKTSDAPYLNNDIVDPIESLLTAESPLALMAWHVMVATIWGDVVDFVHRAPFRAASSYRDAYDSFYAEIWNRLQGWLSRLPEDLHYNIANLDKSLRQGYADTFISIHVLYHLCCMRMNRCLRHAAAQENIARNIRAAHEHGHQMLQLICAVYAARGELTGPTRDQLDTFTALSPFPGYAILAAVDIVSAGGADSTLGSTLDEISGGLMYLQELARFWHSTKEQAWLCERRFYQIQNILKNPLRARGGAWLGRKWGLEKPLDQELPPDHDCIYGLGGSNEAVEIYFAAFGDASKDPKAYPRGLKIA